MKGSFYTREPLIFTAEKKPAFSRKMPENGKGGKIWKSLKNQGFPQARGGGQLTEKM